MDKNLDRKVKKDELRKYFATDQGISLVLNSVNSVIHHWSFRKEDLTVKDVYGYFKKSQEWSRGFRNIGRKSMSSLDRWIRSLELEQIPYQLKHLPTIGEDPKPTEFGRLMLNQWENKSSLVPRVFVAGLEYINDVPTNLVYWDTEKDCYQGYHKVTEEPRIVNIDQVFDYVKNHGAKGAMFVKEVNRPPLKF